MNRYDSFTEAMLASDGWAPSLVQLARSFDAQTSLGEAIALAASDDRQIQAAATWVLRWWMEQGASVSSPQVAELLATFSAYKHWDPKLHAVRLMALLPLNEQTAPVPCSW